MDTTVAYILIEILVFGVMYLFFYEYFKMLKYKENGKEYKGIFSFLTTVKVTDNDKYEVVEDNPSADSNEEQKKEAEGDKE